MTATIHHGDCLDVLRAMPDNSVDAVVTDPPYGLSNTSPDKVAETIVRWANGDREYMPKGRGFMGAEWDAFVPPVAVWDECMRVLKPGGHLVAFAGSRTQDLMGISIRLSGLDVRENLAFLYGSGFPKSHDVHKSTLKAVEGRYGDARCNCLDARNGIADRNELGQESRGRAGSKGGPGQAAAAEARPPVVQVSADGAGNDLRELRRDDLPEAERPPKVEEAVLLAPVLVGGAEAPGHGYASLRSGVEAAQAGDPGQGQDLPLVREDARGERERPARTSSGAVPLRGDEPAAEPRGAVRLLPSHDRSDHESGTGHDHRERHPRRVELDGERGRGDSVARICTWCRLPDPEWLKSLEGVGTAAKPAHEPIILARKPLAGKTVAANTLEWGTGGLNIDATRIGPVEPNPPFMYAAKAPKKERPVHVTEDGSMVQHSTVKPLSIMSWLVKLVTPEGGTVLDPFAGSGTTIEAAILNGFNVIGIEREAAYLPLIQQRIDRANGQLPVAS